MSIPILEGPSRAPRVMPGLPTDADPIGTHVDLSLLPGQDEIERRRQVRLMDVRVKGPIVVLVQQDMQTGKRFSVQISRRDALQRAEAISGMNDNSLELQRALIRACREAYKNETGREYISPALQMIGAEENDGHKSGQLSW